MVLSSNKLISPSLPTAAMTALLLAPTHHFHHQCEAYYVDPNSGGNEPLEWQTAWFGDYLTCPSGTGYMQGFCSSGSNANCEDPQTKQPSYINVGCGHPTETSSTSAVEATDKPNTDLNGWICGMFSDDLECPTGSAMVGACGSGHNPNCESYCSSPEYSAILCEPVTGIYGPDNVNGLWSEPLGFGEQRECGENQVMCGVCQSGGDKNCNGGAWQQKCCDWKKYSTLGYWVAQYQINAPTTYKFQTGSSKSQEVTNTTSWSNSVTATVSAGLSVEGVGSTTASLSTTMSQSFSTSDSQYWSTYQYSETDLTLTNTTYLGKEVWQWVYKITDPFGNVVMTNSNSFSISPDGAHPPKCAPGYEVADTWGQTCLSADGYLPGYNSSGRRRNLRRGNSN